MNKKVNFIIQTKYLKGELSKSVWKTGYCFPTLATLVKVWLNCFQVTGHKCNLFLGGGGGAFYWGKSIKHYSSILVVAFFQIFFFLTENNNGNIFKRNESLNSKFQKNILYSSLTLMQPFRWSFFAVLRLLSCIHCCHTTYTLILALKPLKSYVMIISVKNSQGYPDSRGTNQITRKLLSATDLVNCKLSQSYASQWTDDTLVWYVLLWQTICRMKFIEVFKILTSITVDICCAY